jgi:hypothetical protein
VPQYVSVRQALDLKPRGAEVVIGRVFVTVGRALVDRLNVPGATAKCKAFL